MIDMHKKAYATLLLTLVSLFIVQIPYLTVWIYGVSFPYDAMTDFSPWYIYLIEKLRHCEQVFSIRQDFLGGYPFLSYFYENPVRFLSAYILPNTFSSIAYVQAFHVALTFLLFSYLLRTFRLPWLVSLTGGIIFVMSGINVSLSQHVHSHEILAYFVTILILIRLYILQFDELSFFKKIIYLASLMCVATALARWPHEAVTYLVPIVLWVLLQLYLRMGAGELKGKKGLFLSLLLLGVLTAIACVPQLLYFLEMSEFNKTTVGSYFETGRYFRDFRIFWAGLIFPTITGASEFPKIQFRINTDITLGYIYAGTVTMSLSVIYIVHLAKEKLWPRLAIYMAAVVISLGFAFGAGSPIHWACVRIFPPLGMLHHYYYGIKLFYGLAAFGAAQGLYIILFKKERISTVLSGPGLSIVYALCLYALLVADPRITGLTGDVSIFYRQLNKELIVFILVNSAVAIACILHYRYDREAAKRAFYVFIFLVISASLAVPVFRKHFTPHYTFVFTDLKYNIVLAEAMPVIRELQRHKKDFPRRYKKITVLPVGLDASHNMLVLYGFDSLDHFGTVGNKYIHRAIVKLGSDSAAGIAATAARLGAEYLWVKDRRVNETLSQGVAYFTQAAKSEMLGTLWAFDYKKVKDLSREGDALEISPWAPEEVIRRRDRSLASVWEVDMERAAAMGCRRVTLPIFNLKYFAVYDDWGNRLAAATDDYGRMVIDDRKLPGAKKIVIEYPRAGVRMAILLSNIVYSLGLIGLLVLAGVAIGGTAGGILRNMRDRQ